MRDAPPLSRGLLLNSDGFFFTSRTFKDAESIFIGSSPATNFDNITLFKVFTLPNRPGMKSEACGEMGVKEWCDVVRRCCKVTYYRKAFQYKIWSLCLVKLNKMEVERNKNGNEKRHK